MNHAVDGDGASMCGQVAQPRLVVVDGLSWHDVPAIVACPYCSFLMSSEPMPTRSQSSDNQR
jgi:hypothetical protein